MQVAAAEIYIWTYLNYGIEQLYKSKKARLRVRKGQIAYYKKLIINLVENSFLFMMIQGKIVHRMRRKIIQIYLRKRINVMIRDYVRKVFLKYSKNTAKNAERLKREKL